MKYFTGWLNFPIEERYQNCINKTKEVIPDLEIWTQDTFPKEFPVEWREKKKEEPFPLYWDRFKVWMLANYYLKGAIWIDADVEIVKRFEIPNGKIMVSPGSMPDLWVVGHNRRPEIFSEIIEILKDRNLPFEAHSYFWHYWDEKKIERFPEGVFKHNWLFSAPSWGEELKV